VDTFDADWSAKELSDNPEVTAKDLKRAVSRRRRSWLT
jgi:hypothetical protein